MSSPSILDSAPERSSVVEIDQHESTVSITWDHNPPVRLVDVAADVAETLRAAGFAASYDGTTVSSSLQMPDPKAVVVSSMPRLPCAPNRAQRRRRR